MINLLIWIGRISGLAGLGLAGAAVLTRAMGHWHIGSLSVGTLLLAGIAAMVLGVLAYVAAIAERERPI